MIDPSYDNECFYITIKGTKALCTHWNHKLFFVFDAYTFQVHYAADTDENCIGEMIDSTHFLIRLEYQFFYSDIDGSV